MKMPRSIDQFEEICRSSRRNAHFKNDGVTPFGQCHDQEQSDHQREIAAERRGLSRILPPRRHQNLSLSRPTSKANAS